MNRQLKSDMEGLKGKMVLYLQRCKQQITELQARVKELEDEKNFN